MKPMPASAMQRATSSALISILTPSACNTSAAPDFDDSARLPCFATGTPAPATMKAAQVEILEEPDASPPVPTTSTAPGGAFTPSILARMVVTAPVISSTVSPRTRKAMSRPPICEGVASPDIMRSKAAAASSRVRLAPVATFAMSALKSSVMASARGCERTLRRSRLPTMRGVPLTRDVEKILQHQMTVLGGDAFRMELHAVGRQILVHQTHDKAAVGCRGDHQLVRHTCLLDDERVIARCQKWRVDAAKHARSAVADFRKLAVHRQRRPHHLAAESLPDRLMPETDTEQGNGRRRLGDKIEADAGFVRRAGARREHDRLGGHRHDLGGRNLVVAMHDDVRPLLAQIMDEVEGEAVIVVDQNDHLVDLLLPAQGLTTAPEGGQAALKRQPLWIGSIQGTVSGFSIGSMSRLTTTASLSLRTSTHLSTSSRLALISWCGT